MPDNHTLTIALRDLRFGYRGADANAVDGVSLDVPDGSLFGLLGPNGSGKTTLISLICGLLTATSGRIAVGGRPMPGQRAAIQRELALVPQEYAFYPSLTVMENLRFFTGAQRVATVQHHARVEQAIGATGLDGHRRKRAQHLSGGLKRRLNLAIGLLNAPRILLLDEPTVGIDPQSRHFILEAIKRINADGTTVIYTSHYMEEVEALCDEIAILDGGRIIAQGNLQELLGHGAGGPLTIGLADASAAAGVVLAAFPESRLEGRDIVLPHCSAVGLEQLLAQLNGAGIGITRVRYGYADLEDLFLRTTGHQLRD